ncbi:hypothetical protein FOE78_06940 [Microlunatus elymi]|uniref:Uncharacterized protein n=1 Tax=Microlunatus elymi TaxID=2596828 RepID=A0A516PWW9_9ACTN|nr:hypothetical protein [Microlunatus elymi]QDP95676.1 hypothetical protein FOE78_06940 [Microlunatus elymi]
MSAFDVVSWMILIALVMGVVLLLGRTHRRSTELDWAPAESDDDADLRRVREDVRTVASSSGLRAVRRVIGEIVEASSFDRARAELLEAPDPKLDRHHGPDQSRAA